MMVLYELAYADPSLQSTAEHLATKLGFIINNHAESCLFLNQSGLGLKIKDFAFQYPNFDPIFWNKRKQDGKKQGLVQACKPYPEMKIIDATAGWGRDAALLASFGAQVLMLERHPVMNALLEDALLRSQNSLSKTLPLTLIQNDAFSYLADLEPADYPEIIYLDPMHPQRSKSALVKKDMQTLQLLVGPDKDVLELIHLACSRTKNKVVLKWPQKAQSLIPANLSITGKTVRFDIFLKR